MDLHVLLMTESANVLLPATVSHVQVLCNLKLWKQRFESQTKQMCNFLSTEQKPF